MRPRGSESPECRCFLLSLAWPSGRRCHPQEHSSGSGAESAEAPWRFRAHDALVVDGAEAVRCAPRGTEEKRPARLTRGFPAENI